MAEHAFPDAPWFMKEKTAHQIIRKRSKKDQENTSHKFKKNTPQRTRCLSYTF
jgi:hypothetical protein